LWRTGCVEEPQDSAGRAYTTRRPILHRHIQHAAARAGPGLALACAGLLHRLADRDPGRARPGINIHGARHDPDPDRNRDRPDPCCGAVLTDVAPRAITRPLAWPAA